MADGSAHQALDTINARPDETDAGSDEAFFATWLRRQCAATAGARAGVVLRQSVQGMLAAGVFPAGRQPPVELTRIAQRAAATPRPIIAWARRPDGKPGLDLLVALCVQSGGAPAAVIAVAVDVPGGIESVDPDLIAEQLQLGAGWLDARLTRQRTEAAMARTERAAVAMDIVAVASAQRRPKRAATAVVNELAIRLGCERVSLGLKRRRGMKMEAMSHVASFQERGRVVDAIENAMEECLAQGVPVAYPGGQPVISVAHRDLAALDRAGSAAASVMLPGPDGPVGVLTLERHGAIDAETLALAEVAGALLGPVLRTQIANDRIVSGRALDTAHDAVTTMLGRDKPGLKLAVITGLLLAAVLALATADYRVTARAVLEGEVQRAAVAPFDGYVASSPVRPGDRVKAGDLLAAMDDRDLVLERARAWAETEKLRQKYNEAVAKHDRPNTAMLAAQIEQASAQLALAEDKLKRTRITAPIDGLLVSGDLSQLLGSPIERGKTLFELAPLDRYRVVLRADERELRFLAPGQHGHVLLAGMPGDKQAFTVTRITPIAEAKDGRNEFRVEAMLDDPAGLKLRPGMEGVAKVETGSHNLVWAWTHGVVDWARLMAWKWVP